MRLDGVFFAYSFEDSFFHYGTKLLNHIKIGFPDMLDNNLRPPMGTFNIKFLVESSFLVFST